MNDPSVYIHVDLTFQIIWLQKMAANIGFNNQKAILYHDVHVLETVVIKNYISTAKYQNIIEIVYVSVWFHLPSIQIYWTKVKTLHYNSLCFVRKYWTKRIY